MRELLAVFLLLIADFAFGQSTGHYTRYPSLLTPIDIPDGGTGASTAAGARANLSAAKSGANSDITSLSAIDQTGVVFNDTSGPPTNTVTIIAPNSVGTSYTLTLPANAGTGYLGSAGGGILAFSNSTPVTQNTLNDTVGAIIAKQDVALRSTANVTLSGEQTIDGQMTNNTLVLLCNQTDASENGIYLTAPGAWGRNGNMNDNAFSAIGSIVSVEGDNTTIGTTYNHTIWSIQGDTSGPLTCSQIPTTGSSSKLITKMGACAVGSSTPSTTAANLTCTGVPASTSTAVSCSGSAAFSTPTAGGLYCRATGTINQIACNTAVANTQAMTLTCQWMQP